MKNDPPDPKRQSLLEHGNLHVHPESVTDARFNSEQDFFDPRDLLQVKYEMLRMVLVDNEPASQSWASGRGSVEAGGGADTMSQVRTRC